MPDFGDVSPFSHRIIIKNPKAAQEKPCSPRTQTQFTVLLSETAVSGKQFTDTL
jgi:hypothetical protein